MRQHFYRENHSKNSILAAYFSCQLHQLILLQTHTHTQNLMKSHGVCIHVAVKPRHTYNGGTFLIATLTGSKEDGKEPIIVYNQHSLNF